MIDQSIQNTIIKLLEKCEFKKLCDDYFSEPFYWVIKGSSVLSGEYHDKAIFFEKVLGRLGAVVTGDWKMHILGVYVADDVMTVEMRGEVKTKSGGDYNNDYCWIFHFDNNKVSKLTAYYDSLLVNKTFEANE